jgi:hypothetical protein
MFHTPYCLEHIHVNSKYILTEYWEAGALYDRRFYCEIF